jgi:hypothetical protein
MVLNVASTNKGNFETKTEERTIAKELKEIKHKKQGTEIQEKWKSTVTFSTCIGWIMRRIVPRICADFGGKCSLWVKSTKFGGELGIDLQSEISLGPKQKIQNGRHFSRWPPFKLLLISIKLVKFKINDPLKTKTPNLE